MSSTDSDMQKFGVPFNVVLVTNNPNIADIVCYINSLGAPMLYQANLVDKYKTTNIKFSRECLDAPGNATWLKVTWEIRDPKIKDYPSYWNF